MAELHQPAMSDNYYVTNFHTLAGFVVKTYSDILSQEEFDWYTRVSSVSEPAQRLYIRLLTRKRSVFRISRLNYPEIDRLEDAAAELAAHKLACVEPPADLRTLLSCFTKPELLVRLDLQALQSLSRAELAGRIENSQVAERLQYADQLCTADKWVSIQGYQYWMLMQLCFFGNLYQDSSEFVLRQLGTLTYENYPLDRATRAFLSRQQLEAHWHYFECDALFECTDQRNAGDLLRLANNLPCPDRNDVNLLRRVDRLRNRIARQLERLAHIEAAISLYEASCHPPARERRARLMMHQQQWQQALDLLRQILQKPYNESEQLVARRLYQRCQVSLGVKQEKTPVFKPASSKLVLSDQGVRVEELARRYYASKGICRHTENTLVNGVLGLFIWDILFYPWPGVFFNPFQAAPADFNQPEFYARRAALLDARLTELNDKDAFGLRIQSAFESHYGKQNPLVRWHGLSLDVLALAIDRVPAEHWLVLFQRILSDPRENASGFPDLVLFSDSGGYEFIEIKGPGDTLQANQRRWMQYFDQYGIPCRLVHVRYRSQKPLIGKLNKTAQ